MFGLVKLSWDAWNLSIVMLSLFQGLMNGEFGILVFSIKGIKGLVQLGE